jgi:hypothetical protein
VTTLNEYITHHYGSRRTANPPHAAQLSVNEEVGDICFFRSAGLNGACVALPAGTNLELRAARINAFWKELVGFQDRDVFVVATCAGAAHERD